jgi:hypothetical protein
VGLAVLVLSSPLLSSSSENQGGTINLTFRRNFGEAEQTEWEILGSALEGVALTFEKKKTLLDGFW